MKRPVTRAEAADMKARAEEVTKDAEFCAAVRWKVPALVDTLERTMAFIEMVAKYPTDGPVVSEAKQRWAEYEGREGGA